MFGSRSHHCGYIGNYDFFLYSSAYSCHPFLISSASVSSIFFSVLYCAHLCMKCSLGISNFLEKISRLSHSIILFYSLHSSLRKVFLYLLAILWNSIQMDISFFFSFAFLFSSFLFSAICTCVLNHA